MTSIRAVVVREIRTMLPAMIFFLCLFHLIYLTRAASAHELGYPAVRATVATVAALIVAKAIVIAEKLPVADFFSGTLVLHALWKALLFGAVTLLFRFLEELIPLLLKHDSLATAIAHVSEEIPWPQFWVFQLWLFGALFFYCLAWELIRLSGRDKVRAALWGPVAEANA